MELKFLPYENAPWEAIFFACMYNKMRNKDLILLTQSSTAVVNVILMFKVYNFKIILLHPLFEKLKKQIGGREKNISTVLLILVKKIKILSLYPEICMIWF